MNQGKTVFAQLMSMIPEYEFDKCVDRYIGNHRVRQFTCRDHFYVMSFAQLTQRDSLRDIENCLKAVSGKLYHCGISMLSQETPLQKPMNSVIGAYMQILPGCLLILHARCIKGIITSGLI